MRVGSYEVSPVLSTCSGIVAGVFGIAAAKTLRLQTMPTVGITLSTAAIAAMLAGVRKAATRPAAPYSSTNTNAATPIIQIPNTPQTIGASVEPLALRVTHPPSPSAEPTATAEDSSEHEGQVTHEAIMARAQCMQNADYAKNILLTVKDPQVGKVDFTCKHFARTLEHYCTDRINNHILPLGPNFNWKEFAPSDRLCLKWKNKVLDLLERLATNTSDHLASELNQLLGALALLIPKEPPVAKGAYLRKDDKPPVDLHHNILALLKADGTGTGHFVKLRRLLLKVVVANPQIREQHSDKLT